MTRTSTATPAAARRAPMVAWARYLTALSDARASIPDPYRCDPSDPSDPAARIERCFAALSEAEQALMQYREAVEAEARS